MTITAAEALRLCREALKHYAAVSQDGNAEHALEATKEFEDVTDKDIITVQETEKTAVYWRKSDNTLSSGKVDTKDHEEAILVVKETLVASREGYNGAVLAVIK